jgi:hypothetical protein
VSSFSLRSGAVVAALALSLSACATAEPTFQGSPTPTSSPSSAAPEKPALDCAAVAAAVFDGEGLELMDPFGEWAPIAAATEGGLYCEAVAGAADDASVERAAVVVMPTAIAEAPTGLDGSCGTTWSTQEGCVERLVVDDATAEVVVIGDWSSAAVPATVERMAAGVLSLLESGARPAAGSGPGGTPVDCGSLDMSQAALPAAFGAFQEFGGNGAGAPLAELGAVVPAGTQISCVTVTDGDPSFIVGLDAVPGDFSLAATPTYAASAEPIELGDGRAAMMMIEPEGEEREFATIVTSSDGVILIMRVLRSPEDERGAPIAEVAPVLAEAVAAVIDARG